MPMYLAIPYFILEALAFWAVASWLGVGWALVALFAFFFFGLIFAAWEMMRISSRLLRGPHPGQEAGNLALTAGGAMLIALPGFVSTLVGLLLVIPPTRAMVRKVLARKITASIEEFGVRTYEQAAAFRPKSSTYGSFGTGGGVVLNEDGTVDVPSNQPSNQPSDAEIEAWSSKLDPDDFLRGSTDDNSNGGGSAGGDSAGGTAKGSTGK